MPNFQKELMLALFLLSILLVVFNSILKMGKKEVIVPEYLIISCDIEASSYENSLNYDKDNKTLEIKFLINCCGINTSVEKSGKTYFIYEKQYGDLCKCLCSQKTMIFNVENDARVIFISLDNRKKILSPNLEFCGKSTYSECQTDDDCVATGCSNQTCQSKYEEMIITTCEFRECFDVARLGVSCKCVDNMCQWK